MNFNDNQRELIEVIDGPVLCIAGPGSGKTTSILSRVLNMVKNGINAKKILVVTFTKAAADEMKERYLALEDAIDGVTFGTIHSVCFKILRNYDSVKYSLKNVIDEYEQKNFIRNQANLRKVERLDQEFIVKSIMGGISAVKNNQLNPYSVEIEGYDTEDFVRIYREYEEYKANENKIDYDDMVSIVHDLFNTDAKLLNMWRNIFSHIIIDEYQDTNKLQSEIFYKLAAPNNNICVVGDDDQCQPSGTKILLKDGSVKNIEDIEIGDKIMSFDEDNVLCSNNICNTVLQKNARSVFDEKIVKITTSKNLCSRYTFDHKTYVDINFNFTGYATFVMNDKDGIFYTYYAPFSHLVHENVNLPTIPWVWYMDMNECDKLWIVDVFNSEKDAEDLAYQLSNKYGLFLPEVLLDKRGNIVKVDYTLARPICNHNIDEMFNEINKDKHYPLINEDNIEDFLVVDNDKPFVINAINIIKDCMNAFVCKVVGKDVYTSIDCVKDVSYHSDNTAQIVYSLKTATGNYIADSIVTHNCIYRFRGAIPQIMLDFEKKFSNCKKVILNVNYRSEPKIVESTKKLIEHNKVRFAKPLVASKTGDANITFDKFKNRDKEIASIIKSIKYAEKKGEPLEEIAVLYRTNNQAPQIAQAFIKANIPFYTNELVLSIYDHWIFRDIKTFKKVSDGTCSLNEFLSIINRPNKYISRKILPQTYSEEAILKAPLKMPQQWQREKTMETLSDWYYWIDKMRSATPKRFIEIIRKNLEYDKFIKTYAEENKMEESQFTDILNEIEANAEPFENFDEWYKFTEKELEEFKEKLKTKHKSGSVTLSTMHKSKGLEWDTVYIVDVNEEITPYVKAVEQEDLEEERRMFYVATTRARKNLHICTLSKRNKKELQPSRFIKEITLNEEKEVVVEQDLKSSLNVSDLQPRKWVFHKTFGSGVILNIDGDTITVTFNDVGIKKLQKQWCLDNLQLFE